MVKHTKKYIAYEQGGNYEAVIYAIVLKRDIKRLL